ncbi:MAG: hypothetical protein JWP40_671 [Blastococcus sp.]|jgi:hypothetical protein|nr:hypothetical protein [Blastococcus sp.]
MERFKFWPMSIGRTFRRGRVVGSLVVACGLAIPLGVVWPASAAEQSYAAVAFSPSLKALREGFGATANDAQAVALNACLAYAAGHQADYYKDCAPFAWVHNGFVGFASSGRAPRELDWAWGSGWGHTADQAVANSGDVCRSWGGGKAGRAACIQVGGSPFRSHVYDVNAPTEGGGPTVQWRTAPLPPRDLVVKMVNSTTIRLRWTPVSADVFSPPSSWEISNGDVTRSVTPQTATYDWTVLPDQYMCFKVRGVNDVGASWWEPNVDPWYRCAGSRSY